MRSLRKKRMKTPESAAGTWDPFAAIPHIADGVEVREDSRGLLQIRKTVAQKPGFMASIGRALGLERRARVILDAEGTLFWKQIDGRRSLRDIEKLVCPLVPEDDREKEKAIILFTKMLMARDLIRLEIKTRQGGE